MSKRILAFVFNVVFFLPLLCAQSPTLSNLNLENGLPGSSVKCLFQDRFGYVWMGIESKGLCRYDGTKFVMFSSQRGDSTTLSNNFVTSICEDQVGNLWVGTEAGLNLYHRNTSSFTRFYSSEKNPNSLVDNKINFIEMDSRQILWIGTDKGLNSLNLFQSGPHEFKRHILPHSLPFFTNASDISANSFFEDKLGNRWIGAKNGLFRYDKKLSKLMYWPAGKNTDNGLDCNKILSIIQLGNKVYLGTNDGIFTFDYTQSDHIQFHRLPIISSTTNITDLVVVKDKLWIATDFEGLYTFPLSQLYQTTLSKATKITTLDSDLILDIMLSQDSTVWVASRLRGVYIAGKHTTLFKLELEGKEVTAILRDDKGLDWIGTKTDGVYVRDPQTKISKQVLSHEECNQVNSIIKFEEELYIGCISGIVRFHPEKRKLTFFEFSKIQSIVSWKDQLIIGTKNGVHLFHPNTSTFQPLPLAQDSDNLKLATIITGMARTGNTLWIGTDSKGLMRYDFLSKELTSYMEIGKGNKGLRSNYIKALYADRNGMIWIGSKYEGLDCFNPRTNQFLHFDDRHGLSNLSVYAITEDSHGAIWLGTHEAISRFQPSFKIFDNYNSINGRNQNVTTTPNAAFASPSGEILYGSKEGLISFHPDSVIESGQGKFILSSLQANGKYRLNAIDKDTSLDLSFRENFLQFDFAYIDFLKSSSTLYYYKLKDHNDEWMEAGKTNLASFSNLPAGTYRFQFGIRDRNGKIKEVPFSVMIHIKPYLLRSPVAYILYALVIIFIAVLFWKYILAKQKINDIKRQMVFFQELVHTKQQLLNEQLEEKKEQPPLNTNSSINSSKLDSATFAKAAVPELLNEQATLEKAQPDSDTNEYFLKKCYLILEGNYADESFNVAQFSQEIGMSRTNFYNKLKSTSGFTPSSMIWEYRLLKAAHFLKDRPKAISNIALECGFENISSFSTMFKKRFGKTPSDFRASLFH